MFSTDDLIGATEMTPQESAHVHEQLMLAEMVAPQSFTVSAFAEGFGLKPMLVARTLSDYRREDTNLSSLIATNEFLIKNFGKKRYSREFVEGRMLTMDRFWRNNDPLGVYRPGDMFYVDDNHPWMKLFPFLILVPTMAALLLLLVAALIRMAIH